MLPSDGRRAAAGERTLVRDELVDTQEEIIGNLQTQLAALTALLQGGVRLPLDALVERGGHAPPESQLHVYFDREWRWDVSASA